MDFNKNIAELGFEDYYRRLGFEKKEVLYQKQLSKGSPVF
jgi:hypothetical protein